MYKRLIALVVVGLPPGVSTAQTGCEALLKGGLFDTSIDVSTSSGRQQFKQWYCSQHFQSSNDAKKLGLGATIPIDGVPIPFTFDGSQSSFTLNYEQYCNDTNVSSDQQNATSSIVSKASPVIMDGFNRCMALPGLHYRMMVIGTDVVIAAKFATDGPQRDARVTTVQPSANLRCDSSVLTDVRIGGNEVPMTCHRTNLDVASISIGADTGNVFIATLKDLHPLPPPQIGHQTYTFRFCGATGCAPSAHQLAWGPSAGAPTVNGWCSLQDMRPYMPPGAELVVGQTLTDRLVPTTIYKGDFHHLHPTLIQPLSTSVISFCGYRDGDGNDWDKDDMELSVRFAYLKP